MLRLTVSPREITSMDLIHATSHLYQHLGDVASGAATAVVLSAAVRALPEPMPMGSALYGWFYRFTQAILSNYDKLSTRGRDEVYSDDPASHV